MGRIQTGVDKLVALVKEKQKVSVDEAAKSLGVSKTIVQEWADFLGEEGIVEVKYSLSKTYLLDRKLTKTEAAAKEEQFEQQRETFVTKVDQSIGAIQHEVVGFEQFRKEFDSLKSELGTSLSAVQRELGSLKQFETRKTRVVKDVHKERSRLAREEAAAETAIKREYRRYHDVLSQIGAQEKKLIEHKRRVQSVLRGEAAVGHKIAEYETLLLALRSRVKNESHAIGADVDVLKRLQRSAQALRSELTNIEQKRLQPLVVLRDKHQEKLKLLERSILEKAANERRHARKPNGGAVAARRKLEEFFRRKKTVEHLLETIEDDKRSLLGELEQLEKRAEAYRVSKTAAKLDELREKLKQLDEGKARLHGHVQAFLKNLH